jgi:hypothetical protein
MQISAHLIVPLATERGESDAEDMVSDESGSELYQQPKQGGDFGLGVRIGRSAPSNPPLNFITLEKEMVPNSSR